MTPGTTVDDSQPAKSTTKQTASADLRGPRGLYGPVQDYLDGVLGD